MFNVSCMELDFIVAFSVYLSKTWLPYIINAKDIPDPAYSVHHTTFCQKQITASLNLSSVLLATFCQKQITASLNLSCRVAIETFDFVG